MAGGRTAKWQLTVVMCIVCVCLSSGCDQKSRTELDAIRPLGLEQRPQHGEFFPWEDVEECLKIPAFTHEGRPTDPEEAESTFGRPEHGPHLRPCPKCGKAPENLTWVYYISPMSTWFDLAGREGWLTVCWQCHKQVDFICLVMN